jgi:hypothetical protein
MAKTPRKVMVKNSKVVSFFTILIIFLLTNVGR